MNRTVLASAVLVALLNLAASGACKRRTDHFGVDAGTSASDDALVPPTATAVASTYPVDSAFPTPKADASAPSFTTSFASAKEAMAELSSGVTERDVARVLACFSRQRPWSYAATETEKPRRVRFTFAQLETGLSREDGDFRGLIFGDDDLFSLHHYMGSTPVRAWQPRGRDTFVPPEGPVDPSVYVKWRKEGKRYVVDEIALPGE